MTSNFSDVLHSFDNQLTSLGLLSGMQIDALARHGDFYPCDALHRLFFEYQLTDDEIAFEGYGQGFDLERLIELLSNDDFQATSSGAALVAALAGNPFSGLTAANNRRTGHVPEWIEYDYSAAALHPEPGVFFEPPTRLKIIEAASSIDELCQLLVSAGGRIPSDNEPRALGAFLKGVLAAERAAGSPLRIHRLGLSEARAPGWLRLILGGVHPNSFDKLLTSSFGEFRRDAINRIVELASVPALMRNGRVGLAASVDFSEGTWTALDIEGPSYQHIIDLKLRFRLANQFVERLIEDGIVSPKVGALLGRLAVRAFDNNDQTRRALVVLSHFKFGVAGRTTARTKVYFEVLLYENDAWPARWDIGRSKSGQYSET